MTPRKPHRKPQPERKTTVRAHERTVRPRDQRPDKPRPTLAELFRGTHKRGQR